MGVRITAVKFARRTHVEVISGSDNMNDDLPAVLFAIFVSLAVVVLLFCWVATCVSLLFGPTYHQRRQQRRVASLKYLGWTMEVERSGSVARIRKDSCSFTNALSLQERPRSLVLSPSAPNVIAVPPTPQTTPNFQSNVPETKPTNANAEPPDYEPPPTYAASVRSVRFESVQEV